MTVKNFKDETSVYSFCLFNSLLLRFGDEQDYFFFPPISASGFNGKLIFRFFLSFNSAACKTAFKTLWNLGIRVELLFYNEMGLWLFKYVLSVPQNFVLENIC